MPTYFAIIWVPYLFLLYNLIKRRSVYAPILIICVGMLNYKLPVYFVSGVEPAMWYVGILFCISITLAQISIQKRYPFSNQIKNDSVLTKVVLAYAILVFLSVMIASDLSLIKKATFSVDVALLFIIIIQCLKTEKDILLLLKGIVFGVFLMAAIGMIGITLDDPFWGHAVSQDETEIIEVRAIPNLTYKQRLYYQTLYSRDITLDELSLRPRFTSSSPNDMAAVMLLTIPLVVFLYFKFKNIIFRRLIWISSICLFIACVLLSGSRTIFIVGILILPIFFLRLFLFRYIGKFGLLSIMMIMLISSISMFSGDIGSVSRARISALKTVADVIDANGRLHRWKNNLQGMSPSVFILGNGQTGMMVSDDKAAQSHMNYISIIYRGGFIALFAFLICLFKSMKNSLAMNDKFMGHCIFTSLLIYALAGITLDINLSIGPPFIFWALVAILAKSGLRNTTRSGRTDLRPV